MKQALPLYVYVKPKKNILDLKMKYAHVLKYLLNFTAEKPSFERSHILSVQCTNSFVRGATTCQLSL